MDIEQTLRELRLWVASVREDPDICSDAEVEAAEFFSALDGWLSTGGFKPKDWT